MHPALLEGLASQHAEELQAAKHRRAAERARISAASRAKPPPSITQRAGWALIQVGLWLAVRPPDPPPWSTG
jgi:hypothetical protein